TATTTQSLAVTVNPVADAPIVSTLPASGTTDNPIALDIHVELTAPNETLGGTVEITGLPSGYTLNHRTPTDGGAIVSLTDLADLKLVPGADALPGPVTLHITASSVDGPSVAFTTTDLTVTVDAGANQQSGRAFDGYIVGATVFADANHNGVFDPG